MTDDPRRIAVRDRDAFNIGVERRVSVQAATQSND
jgi:hypothetical protein